jgi:hypothetical protein
MDDKPEQPVNLVNGIPKQDLDAWIKGKRHPEHHAIIN